MDSMDRVDSDRGKMTKIKQRIKKRIEELELIRNSLQCRAARSRYSFVISELKFILYDNKIKECDNYAQNKPTD